MLGQRSVSAGPILCPMLAQCWANARRIFLVPTYVCCSHRVTILSESLSNKINDPSVLMVKLYTRMSAKDEIKL